MLCAVECLEQPSKRSLKNYLGRDLHEFLVGKLDKAWAAKHGKKIEVSTAEMLEVAATSSTKKTKRRRRTSLSASATPATEQAETR